MLFVVRAEPGCVEKVGNVLKLSQQMAGSAATDAT
jgi:hypothetical protein